MVSVIDEAVSPLLQLVNVTILFDEAVSMTLVPSSYMFLPSMTVGTGASSTM